MANKQKRFLLSQENWDKIIAYAESAHTLLGAEIGGQLVVIEDKDGDFILEDPVILKQTVSAGNCEMEEEALALHYSKMAKKYGDNIRHCWWHSHHTMAAFWSGTDTSTIEENESNDWTLSLVVNLKQEYKLRVQWFHPYKHGEDIELEIMYGSKDRNKVIDDEVLDLCEKEHVVTYGTRYQGYGWGPAGNNKQNNNQLALSQQDDDIWGYNQGFDSFNADLDTSKCKKKELDNIITRVECLQDMYTSQVNCDYQKYSGIRKVINKDIKKYNMRIKYIKEDELMMTATTSYPDDFLENIKEVN